MTKWTVTEVSQATGESEGSISAYFSDRNMTTKDGLTLDKILIFLMRENKREHGKNRPEKVMQLVKILQVAGFPTPYCYHDEEATL